MTRVFRSLIASAGLAVSLVAAVATSANAAHRQPDPAPAIDVGGTHISAPAFVDNGRVFVPVRGVFEAIGASVSYVAPHFVVVRKDSAVVAAFILDRRHAIVGRHAVELDGPPTRRDGRIYVPLRVVAEAAGATVAYTSRPAVVHITPAATSDIEAVAPPPDGPAATAVATPPSNARWLAGVAVVTGVCSLLCLVLTARRFAPTLFRPRGQRVGTPAIDPPTLAMPPADRVALTLVEAAGEARFRTETVTETRTIEVPVTREELVIEYAGEGGVVMIEGRQLMAGETIRIPLWEERVSVDVTKHVLLTEDIVAARRRSKPAAPGSALPPDFTIAEGNPS